jgi:hypothetical protein
MYFLMGPGKNPPIFSGAKFVRYEIFTPPPGSQSTKKPIGLLSGELAAQNKDGTALTDMASLVKGTYGVDHKTLKKTLKEKPKKEVLGGGGCPQALLFFRVKFSQKKLGVFRVKIRGFF